MKASLDDLLASLPTSRAQRQDSTDSQISDVEAWLQANGQENVPLSDKVRVANRLGMYDAADIFKLRAAQAK